MSFVELTPDQLHFLKELSEQNDVSPYQRWAQVLLLYQQGLPTHQVASQVGLSPSRTRYIKQVFAERGLAIFGEHAPQPGQEIPLVDAERTAAAQPQEDETVPVEPASPPAAGPASTKLAALIANSDQDAGEFAAGLAGSLFDATRQVHRQDKQAREILITAARLHHLKSKPKSSRAAILAQPIENLTPAEQSLIAELVGQQFVRKSPPQFAGLPPGSPEEIHARQLLGLLRLALAADHSSTQTAAVEVVSTTPDELHIRLRGSHALSEATSVQSASALWSQTTGQVVHVFADAGLDLDAIHKAATSLSSPGIHADDSMAEAGRKVLRYHFLEMLLHEPGTRQGEDIEELHDMRVATRRMRAAFQVYGDYFQPKTTKVLLRGLRATGRALGPVRDMDVFIEKAGIYLDSLADDAHADLSPLIDQWHALRAASREKMLAHLDSDEYAKFVYQMNEFVNTPGMGAVPFNPTDPQPFRVREVAPMLIYTRLASVRAYTQLLDNASYEQLHALRIAFKYLRYTVEFFREVLGSESRSVIDEIKRMQDHLGDLNDADVACRLLQDFLEDWEPTQIHLPLGERRNPEPIVRYLAYRTDERHQLLVSFPQSWQTFLRPDFLTSLALSVSIL